MKLTHSLARTTVRTERRDQKRQRHHNCPDRRAIPWQDFHAEVVAFLVIFACARRYRVALRSRENFEGTRHSPNRVTQTFLRREFVFGGRA